MEEIDIKDLLSRKEAKPIKELLKINIDNKSVMITGAGGSIGSELCRQVIKNNPKKIILLENSEYALYSIHTELEDIIFEKNLDIKVFPILMSIRKTNRLKNIISKYKVNSIYHAAAFKHVSLVEKNIVEGIENNIFGTLSVVKAAVQCDVESFILISTDKAVRSTNIMGATKRIAEIICKSFSLKKNGTSFTMVRFGNVLGSSGSVIPRFKQQIKSGGPVFVTSPDVTRYVMTISEAVQLVIQAGALSENGDLLILDMGDPIKIVDLAKKMIRLSGFEPYIKDNNQLGDIEILFTGLRSGEKLHEELVFSNKLKNTIHPRIMKASDYEENLINYEKFDSNLDKLLKASQQNNIIDIIDILKDSYSEYNDEYAISDITS